MTKDLCYYFEKDYGAVLNAFHRAASQKFGRDCRIEEGKILSFGLNFSFRYNMNGGALRIFFMRCGAGTAVNLHYIIAQLIGARCGAHAKAIIAEVEKILGVRAVENCIPLATFVSYQHAENFEKASAETDAQGKNGEAEGRKICFKCQTSLPADSRFCLNCGAELQMKRFCGQCGKSVQSGANFCADCGAKI